IVKIPVHGLAYAGFKGLVRFPPQFPLDLAGVNRITPVMTRSILDEGDELAVRHHRVVRPELVEKGADRGHNVEVWLLILASDVVGLSDSSSGQHLANCSTMISDEQPISHVPSIAIDWNWPSAHSMQNHQRDQFFGKLVRTVVVGT